jgi:hypothetical protein
MDKLLHPPVLLLLLALACSDVDLAPCWGEYELPDGPALGLRDIDYDSGTGFAVGAGGQAWFCHHGQWSEDWTPVHGDFDVELTGVDVSDGGNVWVCGADGDENGHLYTYNYDLRQGSWKEIELDGAAFLADVAARDDGCAVTVGSGGQVWRQWTDWELVWSDADYLWRAVDLHISGEVLVAGGRVSTGNGAYLRFNYFDVDCTVDEIAGGRLEDCALTDSDAGWAVGADGCVYLYGSGTMQTVADTGVLLRGLAVEPDCGDSLWLCGPGGALVHYVDGEMEYPDPPTDENLHDLVLVDGDEGWAAAQTLLLEYR